MVLLPASILVLLYTFQPSNFVSAQASSSETYSLSNEITNIIPPCARTCFTSFIQSNYPSSACTTSPTLDCLCSHSSTSGYTIGEGAVQCIISEDNVKFCQGADATGDVARNAYNMCVGKANALPNTHATITATLVVETQTSSPSTLPSGVVAATTPSDTSVSNSISASLPSSTLDAGTPTSSPSGPSLVAITNTPTVIVVSQTAQPSNSTISVGLTTPQVAGIAVGSGVAAIFAIGALVLWACLRRRRILGNDHDSDFGFEVQHDNSMEHMFRGGSDKQYGRMGPGGTADGLAAKLPPRIPPRLDTDQNMFSRRSVPVLEIGVAISPDRNQVAEGAWEHRHASKLLPEKPTLPKLAVVIPSQPISRPWRPPFAQDRSAGARQENGRDSVATQFEEDVLSPEEASARTVGHLDIGFAYTPQQVVLPQPANWHMTEPPRSMTVPPPAVVKPLEIRKSQSHQSFSKPLRPRTGGSSVYSQTESPDIPYLVAHYSNKTSQPPKTYKAYNPYAIERHGSSGSTTTIESAAEPEPRIQEPHIADLSPVAESPAGQSPVGRSPVSYPKIPGRLSDHFAQGPKYPLLEPWRVMELEAAKNRAQAHQRPRGTPPLKRHEKDSTQGYDSHQTHQIRYAGDPISINNSLGLAQRRGNKLAPALDLNGDVVSRPRGKWRVLKEGDTVEIPLQSPAWSQGKLTPKKIGDDLFIKVEKY